MGQWLKSIPGIDRGRIDRTACVSGAIHVNRITQLRVRWFKVSDASFLMPIPRPLTYRVFGGADGPVRLDAHITLDSDSLWIDRSGDKGIARSGCVKRHAGWGGREIEIAKRNNTRHSMLRFHAASLRLIRTFLAAKDFFAPANWGRTEVEEAMACMFSNDGVGRVGWVRL